MGSAADREGVLPVVRGGGCRARQRRSGQTPAKPGIHCGGSGTSGAEGRGTWEVCLGTSAGCRWGGCGEEGSGGQLGRLRSSQLRVCHATWPSETGSSRGRRSAVYIVSVRGVRVEDFHCAEQLRQRPASVGAALHCTTQWPPAAHSQGLRAPGVQGAFGRGSGRLVRRGGACPPTAGVRIGSLAHPGTT